MMGRRRHPKLRIWKQVRAFDFPHGGQEALHLSPLILEVSTCSLSFADLTRLIEGVHPITGSRLM